MHSVYSDGKYTPTQLVSMLKAAGVGFFSVTDHDSMEGAEEAEEAAKRAGLLYVRGWEVSSYLGSAKVHVLGYGCERGKVYDAFVEERRQGARERAEEMIALANDYYSLDVTLDEVEGYHVCKIAPLHTMHIVRAFAARLGKEEGEMYLEAFSPGKFAFSEVSRPSPEEAVEVIRAAGGIAVLAHPGRVFPLPADEYYRLHHGTEEERAVLREKNFRNREKLMEKLIACGLGGIECAYTTHTAEETEYFSAFADAHGLIKTGGSDFHAEGGRNVLGLPVFDADEERLLRR